MRNVPNSSTSLRFRFPLKNSRHAVRRLSTEIISSYEIWNGPLTLSLSLGHASILQRIKEGYLLWLTIVPHIPKGARYVIGARIENKFLDLLECAYAAYYCTKEQKAAHIETCIMTLDVLKFLITTAWEGKCIANRHIETVAATLSEAGRMLGGWKKSLENPDKKNRTM